MSQPSASDIFDGVKNTYINAFYVMPGWLAAIVIVLIIIAVFYSAYHLFKWFSSDKKDDKKAGMANWEPGNNPHWELGGAHAGEGGSMMRDYTKYNNHVSRSTKRMNMAASPAASSCPAPNALAQSEAKAYHALHEEITMTPKQAQYTTGWSSADAKRAEDIARLQAQTDALISGLPFTGLPSM